MAVIRELMTKAIGEITANEGVNSRESVIVAGGAAAGINIMPIAREFGRVTTIVPRRARAMSCMAHFSKIVFARSGN